MSIASAGCLLWLERLQPLFATLAITALAYQAGLVWRRPRQRRTPAMLTIFWASFGTCLAISVTLIVLLLRYW